MANLLKIAKRVNAQRYMRDVTPFTGAALSNTGTDVVTFKLPRQDILVGQDIVLNFKAEADGDGGSDDVFMSNIACVWKGMRVRIDGTEVQNVSEVGHLQCIDDNLNWPSSYRTSWGAICQGVPAVASSGTALRYGMRLLRGNVLSNLIPCYKIGQIELELTLNQSLAQYTDATTAVTEVDITNMSLRCPFLKSPELIAEFDKGDVTVKFTDYDHHRDTSLLSGATSHTVIISTSHSSLDGVLLVMRNTADVNDPDWGGEKYEACNMTNALSRLSFTIDGVQYPAREIDCSQQAELYEYLLEYSGHRQNESYQAGSFFNGAYDTAADGQFVIAMPFNALLGASSKLSGVNTTARTGQLEVRMSAMSASANTQIDAWTRYSRTLTFAKDGGVSFSS